MSKGRDKHRRISPHQSSVKYLLETGNLADLKAAKKLNAEHSQYYWREYSELARQRNLVKEDLSKALTQKCLSSYRFKHWQRGVKYKYALHPLSTVGSLSWVGGRFNTGREVNSEVPTFSALYLASDKDTALQEHLGQPTITANPILTPQERALVNPASETIVSVSGYLDKVFDLSIASNLELFIELIKAFKLPADFKRDAKRLKLQPSSIIKTFEELQISLLDSRWRRLPVDMDVPANSQIFGQLVYSASIEGILYPSKFTDKPCLVIFPSNFSNTDSRIWLDDDRPSEKVPHEITGKNYRLCELSFEDILKSKT